MSTLRFQALKDASGRKPVKFEEADKKSVLFGTNGQEKASKHPRLLAAPPEKQRFKAKNGYLESVKKNRTPLSRGPA